MNKLFTKIVGATLGFAMAIGVGVAVAGNNRESTRVDATVPSNWVQCADVSDFAAGDSIIIATNGSSYYFNGATKSGPHWDATALSASAPASATADGVITLVTTGTANKYYLKLAGGTNKDKYVTATKAGSKGSAISASDSNGWTFTKSSTNYFELNYAGNNAKFCSYNNQDFRSYASYSTGQQVTIYKYSARSLSSISVSTAPTKTAYIQGDYFDPTGLVITRTYSDSTSDTYSYAGHTSEFTFSPTTSTALTTSNVSVTITYGGKSTTQAITVTAPKTPASISSVGQATTFTTADKFSYGGTLTATYTDSTNATVSPASFKIGDAGINPTSAGTAIVLGTTVLNRADHHGKTVYVLYTENNTTVYTSYVITVNALSSVTFTAGTDTGTATGSGQSGTISKSGISFYCSSWKNDSGTDYRLYKDSTVTFTSAIGNIAKIEFTGDDTSYKISNLGSATAGTLAVSEANNTATWTGNVTTVSFTPGAQSRASVVKVTLASTDPLVELAGDSATSVSMMKGDTDTTVKVHVTNIASKTWTYTYDEDDEEGLTTSSYISVSAGAAVEDVHTLTITTKAVGSTVLHISVSGTACESTIPVTVAAKPASMTVTHADISEGELEVITGAYKQVSFSGEDTDGNPYSIAAADVTPSAQSGASHVTLSGSRITGASAGDAVVRYTLNALTSVYAEITVHVVDDYIESVGTPTYATGLTDTQGQSPTVSVFTARPGTMHSGTATTVPFENYKFSYEDNYASAVYGSVFSYDFSHGSTVDSTHKLQTIYVFCDIGSTACGSYTVTVEQANDPLTAIAFTNVTNNEVDVARGSTFQLEWAYTPENPTDGKEVEFVIDDNDDGIDITVSSIGLITIGASSNLGTAMVIIQSAHDDTIQDYVIVSAVLETMKYVVNEAETLTPSSTVAVGDRVVMVAVDKNSVNYEFTAFSGTSTDYGIATSYTTSVSKSLVLSVVAGNSSGTVAFKTSDNKYVAWVSAKNSITDKETLDDYGSWTINGTTFQNKQDTTRYMYLNYNNGTPRFACYADKSEDTTGNYTVPTFLKITGGNTNYDVTEALFNAIHNNFGAGKTYQWDATCASFNSSNWSTAGSAVTGISGFANYKLNRAVANAGGNEIEQFLAKYDVVIGKFGTTYDFLGRFTTGGIHYNQARVTNVFGSIDNSNVAMIVVIFSMISITAFAGYMILKKKKEQ